MGNFDYLGVLLWVVGYGGHNDSRIRSDKEKVELVTLAVDREMLSDYTLNFPVFFKVALLNYTCFFKF
ncbi:MAG: hypothetical protein LBS42_03440 [Tannerella sp.]|jgi:hypothetical protein|nr:hypothetical protein [Tannerella sp.]